MLPAIIAAIVLFIAYLAFGITIVEKSLSSLAMPVGFLWLFLLLWVYVSVSLKQRTAFIVAGICLVILSSFGNSYVANQLAKSLERPYFGFQLDELKKLDAVIVLGGGTYTNLNGEPQLAQSGDRVAMAAKVFIAGRTNRIICTGVKTYRPATEALEIGEEAKAILIGLGIPSDSIETIPGQNTSQEMQAIKEWISKNPTSTRIGILTSAWHLNRAMRLADAAGIDAIPIPADFLSRNATVSTGWVIPSADDLYRSSRVVKEYLAALVGR